MARAKTPIRRMKRRTPQVESTLPSPPPPIEYRKVDIPTDVIERMQNLFNEAKAATLKYEEAMGFLLAGLGIDKSELVKIDLNAGAIEYRKVG